MKLERLKLESSSWSWKGPELSNCSKTIKLQKKLSNFVRFFPTQTETFHLQALWLKKFPTTRISNKDLVIWTIKWFLLLKPGYLGEKYRCLPHYCNYARFQHLKYKNKEKIFCNSFLFSSNSINKRFFTVLNSVMVSLMIYSNTSQLFSKPSHAICSHHKSLAINNALIMCKMVSNSLLNSRFKA